MTGPELSAAMAAIGWGPAEMARRASLTLARPIHPNRVTQWLRNERPIPLTVAALVMQTAQSVTSIWTHGLRTLMGLRE